MRRFVIVSLLLLAALNAFGHAGEVHTYMGTVTATHDDGSFAIKKTDGGTFHVHVSNATAFVHADGRAATRADVAAGRRVAATISTDGKTATLVRIGAAKTK